MLAVSDRCAVIELDDGVGKVLVHDLVADVGERCATAGLGWQTTAEAKQQQAGTGIVGVCNSELRTQVADAGVESPAAVKSDPAGAEACFVQEVRAESV